MRISDWSSDVCSSDLAAFSRDAYRQAIQGFAQHDLARQTAGTRRPGGEVKHILLALAGGRQPERGRSEEHTSELQSLMRISYAVFCLKKKKHKATKTKVKTRN